MALSGKVRCAMAQHSEVIVAPFAIIMTNSDSASIREACRLLHATLSDTVEGGSMAWKEDLCDEPVLNQLLCFVINSLDEELMLQVCQLLYSAVYHSADVMTLLATLHAAPIFADVFADHAANEGQVRDVLLNLISTMLRASEFKVELARSAEGFVKAISKMLVEAITEGSEDMSFVSMAVECLAATLEQREQLAEAHIQLDDGLLLAVVRLLLVPEESAEDNEAGALHAAAWRLFAAATSDVMRPNVASALLVASQRTASSATVPSAKVVLERIQTAEH